LRRSRRPLPLTKFVSAFVAGTLPADAIAVTFDDGYADNLLAGKPLLAAADIPATVFLTTGCLDCREEFWGDELARLVLLEHGPQKLKIVVRGGGLHFDFRRPSASGASPWPTWLLRRRRRRAHRASWRALRPPDSHERGLLRAAIRSKFAGRHQSGSGRAMTTAEVRALVDDQLITIGAHTVTHPALTQIGPEARRREIAESKAACEALM